MSNRELDTLLDMSGDDVGASDAWRVGVLLRQTHQRKHREIDLALGPFGTSMAQYVVLLTITEHPEASSHDLAVHTAQTDQALGALLRRLVDSGLVERTAHGGRAYRHRLSPAGQDLMRRCERPVRQALETAFSALSVEELAQLRELLERL